MRAKLLEIDAVLSFRDGNKCFDNGFLPFSLKFVHRSQAGCFRNDAGSR
jgi:hypothetical protein